MFSNPTKNLKLFGLREDMIVADLGAGSGFYAISAAHLVNKGKVYAIEIQKDFLISLRKKVEELHLKNLECILGDIENIGGTKLADDVADAVIVSNVLFQVLEKENLIQEIKRILKPKGKVLLIDWDVDSPVIGNLHKVVKKDEAIEMFKKIGFKFKNKLDVGDHYYGIILVKNNE